MNGLGTLVRQARETLGMKSYELADAIGKQRSFVSRLEAGELKETPAPEDLRAIGRALDLPMRSMLAALGYLDPDEPEPGIAYAIREDDPRAGLLAAVEGLSSPNVAAVAGAARLFADAFRGERQSQRGEGAA